MADNRNVNVAGNQQHERAEPADPQLKALMEYYIPTAYESATCIAPSNIGHGNYEIKPHLLQLLPLFHGLSSEDPYKHIDEFLEVCSTIKIDSLPEEAKHLKLFPFSLRDKAKHWLKTLEPNTITTWVKLQQDFLHKFFPISKTNQIRRAVTNFTQIDGETFHETWERL